MLNPVYDWSIWSHCGYSLDYIVSDKRSKSKPLQIGLLLRSDSAVPGVLLNLESVQNILRGSPILSFTFKDFLEAEAFSFCPACLLVTKKSMWEINVN